MIDMDRAKKKIDGGREAEKGIYEMLAIIAAGYAASPSMFANVKRIAHRAEQTLSILLGIESEEGETSG
jgi:hypothetical protein